MSGNEQPVQLWGGRFASGPAEAMAALSASTHFDWRLAPYDIAGSRAHARVLRKAGLLTEDELTGMLTALDTLAPGRRLRRRSPRRSPTRTCTPRWNAACWSGPAPSSAASCAPAGRATTRWPRCSGCGCATPPAGSSPARSTSSTRWCRQAKRHPDAILPGRTHLQHAQPVLLAHHLMAHGQALLRDVSRLQDWDARTAESPYGSGALAGSSLGLDPDAVAEELGFATSRGELHRRHRFA